MEKLKVYKSTICANLNCVGEEVNNIINYLQECLGLIEDCTLFELKVVLNELILNAVKHGSKEDNSRTVKIVADLNDTDCVSIEVEDAGEGYDHNCLLKKAVNACSEKNISNLKETGRGLLIVKNLCDSVEFNEKGNKVTVKKKLQRA